MAAPWRVRGIPPGGQKPRINSGHTLAAGLRWCSVSAWGAELVGGRAYAPAPLVDAGPYGLGVLPAKFQTMATNAATAELGFTTGAFSVAALFWLPAAVTGYADVFCRALYVDETNNQGWSIYIDPTDQKVGSAFYSNSAFTVYSQKAVNALVPQNLYLVTATSNGSTLRTISVNGLRETSGSTGLNPAATTADVMWDETVGNEVVSIGTWAWARELTRDEIAFHWRDPFGMLL